ncbi:hypothetical protein ATO13_23366 [Stappia sp. 22II-S9-Z10]|nr:hypothetical protein ATO13_23366 [Stappia sp. 22II-S9-Z10]
MNAAESFMVGLCEGMHPDGHHRYKAPHAPQGTPPRLRRRANRGATKRATRDELKKVILAERQAAA